MITGRVAADIFQNEAVRQRLVVAHIEVGLRRADLHLREEIRVGPVLTSVDVEQVADRFESRVGGRDLRSLSPAGSRRVVEALDEQLTEEALADRDAFRRHRGHRDLVESARPERIGHHLGGDLIERRRNVRLGHQLR